MYMKTYKYIPIPFKYPKILLELNVKVIEISVPKLESMMEYKLGKIRD